jgi:uncharacterized protein
MSLALAASALLLGLAGGPHCAVMCGALQAGVARQGGAAGRNRALVALQTGRLVGYSAAGALVAASTAAFASLGAASSALRPVWTVLQVGAFVFGLSLLWTGRVPAWISAWSRGQGQLAQSTPVRFFARMPPSARAAGLGACWAAMPCGLLQSALIVAALSPDAAHGALVMASFAAGSSVSLWLATTAWSRWRSDGLRWARLALPVRFAGALLAGASGFALVHGLGSAMGQMLCL